MSQIVFTLPPVSKAKAAQKYIIEGYRANQHCGGRGSNPYDGQFPLKASWWDQGWCEHDLIDLPTDRREALEAYFAGGGE